MGLTVSCARCHDHKYDPVPTADYYALYSVMNSCIVPSGVSDHQRGTGCGGSSGV